MEHLNFLENLYKYSVGINIFPNSYKVYEETDIFRNLAISFCVKLLFFRIFLRFFPIISFFIHNY